MPQILKAPDDRPLLSSSSAAYASSGLDGCHASASQLPIVGSVSTFAPEGTADCAEQEKTLVCAGSGDGRAHDVNVALAGAARDVTSIVREANAPDWITGGSRA